MIKFAVFSDLHIKANDDIQTKVLENIIEHFDKEVELGEEIDLVFVTGDITNSGKWEEFEIAINFFQRLRASLKISCKNFFIIPGNHDYNREDIGTGYKYVVDPNLSVYQDIFRSDGFDKHAKKAFKNYKKALRKFYGSDRNLDAYSSKLKIADFDIQVTVINSCLANTIGQDKWQPFVDIEEIQSKVKKRDEFDLSITLSHHPPSYFYLDNRHQLEDFLVSSCDILISGHEHRPDYGKRGRPKGQEYVIVTNGCLYLKDESNPERYQYRFSIIEYNKATNEVIINAWHTKRNMTFCARDTAIYPEAKDSGILRFPLEHREKEDKFDTRKDPLERISLNGKLKEFFKIRIKDILKATNRQLILEIRNDLRSIQVLELKEFSLFFLKYLLSEDFIDSYTDLEKVLTRFFVFKQIDRFHNQVLEFYDEEYFKKTQAEDIAIKIIQKGKQRDLDILKEELAITEEKLEELEKRSISVIESYDENKIGLLPPLVEEEITSASMHINWYKQYGLIGDPFPSNEGLENIDENLIDKIIYETNTIKHFKNLIISEDGIRNLINKTIGIYGSFGSGKTTLFQYINSLLKIHHKDILYVTIPLVARATTEEIKRRFFIRLRKILSDCHYKDLGYVPAYIDTEEDCFLMLNNLASNNKKALFIIIEDIYKQSGRKEYIEEVAGFIETLQTYKRDFSSNAIPTSFFFSCIEEVVERIRGDSSTEGSVDFYYRIQPITLDDALIMINKRLEVFAEDPENYTPISRDYLSKLRSITIQRGTPVKTFRKYIEILLARFQRLEFTEESISIHYDEETINTLRKDIETKHQELHLSFTKLKKKSSSNLANFEKFVKILEKMWLEEPIIEGKGDYINFKIYLIHLMDSKLIRKIIYENELGWTLTEKTKEYFDKIHNAYGGLYPSNIIPSIYFAEDLISGPSDKVLLNLENIIKQGEEYGANFLKLLADSKKAYQELKKISQSIDILKKDILPNAKMDLLKKSFMDLLVAFVIQCDKNVDSYSDALFHYETSWYEIPEVTAFSNKIRELTIESVLDKNQKLELLSDYLIAIKELVSKLRRFIQWDNLFSLKHRKIWNGDKLLLNLIRRNLESNNYHLAEDKISLLIKSRLKDFIFNFNQLIYGKDKWKRGLPENINLKIKKIIEKSYSAETIDEKELLSRLNIKDLFSCIEYLDNVKAYNQIEYLKNISNLCKTIKSKITAENPWTIEILTLIEVLNEFHEFLFDGKIAMPWNSQIYTKIEGSVDISKQEIPDLFETESVFPLIFDNDLIPISFISQELCIIELVTWIIKNKDSIEMIFDYRNEKITINKK